VKAENSGIIDCVFVCAVKCCMQDQKTSVSLLQVTTVCYVFTCIFVIHWIFVIHCYHMQLLLVDSTMHVVQQQFILPI